MHHGNFIRRKDFRTSQSSHGKPYQQTVDSGVRIVDQVEIAPSSQYAVSPWTLRFIE
jgi:hypothetical protein